MNRKKLFSVLITIILIFCCVTMTACSASADAPYINAACDAATGKPTLSWNDVEGAKKYIISRSTTGKIFSFKQLSETTDPNFTDDSAVAGTEYYYKVKAKGTGRRVVSEPASIVCTLSSPANLTLKNDAPTGKPQLSWDAVEGAVRYQVYRSVTGTDNTFSLLITVDGTSTTHHNAVIGTRYYYKVKALHTDATANSDFSAVADGVCALPAPESISVAADNVTGKPAISWNAVDGAKKYQIYQSSTGKDGSFTLLSTVTDTSENHSNAVAGTEYHYKIKALHADTEADSAFSVIADCLCKLAKPKITSITTNMSGKPFIEWNAVDGAEKYQIYRSATGKSGSFKAIATATSASYTDKEAKSCKTYYYKVKALHTNSDANSVLSSSVKHINTLPVPVILVEENSDGHAAIRWKEVNGAVGYEVYRSVSQNGTYVKLYTTTVPHFEDGGVYNGMEYFYKVKSVAGDSIYTSDYSAYANFILGGEPASFETMYVAKDAIVALEEPLESASTVTIPYMDEVEIGPDVARYADGTTKQIKYKGKIYYVWMEKGKTLFTSEQSNFDYTREEHTDIQNQILEFAVKWKDEPTFYAHKQSKGIIDSSTGKYGFDCSGFAAYVISTVMKEYNPSFFLTSAIVNLYNYETLYNKGFNNQFDVIDVSPTDIKPGDVIFLKSDPNSLKIVTHCVLYLGNNEYIHASTFPDGVYIAPLTDDLRADIVGVKRYFPKTVKAAEQTLVCTSKRNAKLYEESNSSSNVIDTISTDDKVTLLFTNISGNWGYVTTSEGLTGYVLMKHFTLAN